METFFYLLAADGILAALFLWLMWKKQEARRSGFIFIGVYLIAHITMMIHFIQRDALFIAPLVIISLIVMWTNVAVKKTLFSWKWLLLLSLFMVAGYMNLWRIIFIFWRS